jgi:hypothetical protein
MLMKLTIVSAPPDSSGESDSSDDSDIEGEAASALFMAVSLSGVYTPIPRAWVQTPMPRVSLESPAH